MNEKEKEYKCLKCICRECVNPACKNALCDGAVDIDFDFNCFVEAYGVGSACFMSCLDMERWGKKIYGVRKENKK